MPSGRPAPIQAVHHHHSAYAGTAWSTSYGPRPDMARLPTATPTGCRVRRQTHRSDGGVMSAILRERQDLLDEFTTLLATSPEGTRALVAQGAEGVGKSHTLGVLLDQARKLGYHAIGPIDGRDIAVLHVATALSEPLAGYPLPPHDDTPVVIGVDDAHLADPARLRLDMRWLTRQRAGGCLWVLTTRPGGLAPTALAASEVVHADLGDLPESCVAALVTEVLGGTPGPDLLAFVGQANGHPRLIIDLVVGLRDEGMLYHSGGRIRLLHPRIPQRVVDGVRQRLGALSSRCRQMVHVAAALNRRFCLVTVAEMLNEPVAHLLPLLDEATDAGLVVSDGVEPEFRSALLWQVIRACLPVYLRTALHQQVTGRPAVRPARQDAVLARLSEKERVIAQLAAEGLTNQQIARRVFLSPHTVNYHMRRIFRKLAVMSRIELARLVAASPEPGPNPQDLPTDASTYRAADHRLAELRAAEHAAVGR